MKKFIAGVLYGVMLVFVLSLCNAASANAAPPTTEPPVAEEINDGVEVPTETSVPLVTRGEPTIITIEDLPDGMCFVPDYLSEVFVMMNIASCNDIALAAGEILNQHLEDNQCCSEELAVGTPPAVVQSQPNPVYQTLPETGLKTDIALFASGVLMLGLSLRFFAKSGNRA